MKTIYISKKRLLKHIEKVNADLETMDFYPYHSALYVLENYPQCKYYMFNPFLEIFRPSKRK